jgi:hypothetical protein
LEYFHLTNLPRTPSLLLQGIFYSWITWNMSCLSPHKADQRCPVNYSKKFCKWWYVAWCFYCIHHILKVGYMLFMHNQTSF